MQRYTYPFNMSTNIFNSTPHCCNVDYVIESVVDMQRESLADYVRRIRVRVKKFSLTDVERNSGGGIDASYVNRIENGLVTNVTPDKLAALAKGLQVSEDEMFAVVRGKPIAPMSPTDFESALEAMGITELQAYGGVENLSDEDRAEVIAMLKTLVVEKLKRKPPKSNGGGKKKAKGQ